MFTYEYAIKIGNSFVQEYELGPLMTDDWQKAVDFLRHTLWAQADYFDLEKFDAMSEEELIRYGKMSNPKIRIVRRKIGKWETVKQPEKQKGGVE